MFDLNIFDRYSPSGDLACLLVCYAIIISLRGSYIKTSRTFKVFVMSTYILILSMSTNLLCWLCYRFALLPLPIVIFGVRIIFSIYLILLHIYLSYIIQLLSLKYEKQLIFAISIFNLIGCILPIVIKDAVYVVDGNIMADTGKCLFPLFYIANILIALGIVVKYRSLLIQQFVKALLIISCLSIFVAVVGFKLLGSSCIGMSFLLPIIVVLLMTHSNSYDAKTGALNQDSFSNELMHHTKQKCAYMCLQLNIEGNHEISNALGRDMRNFWTQYFKDAILFNPEVSLFVLKINDQNDITEKLRSIVANRFHIHYQKYRLDYKIIVIKDVDFIHSYQDFSYTLEFLSSDMEWNEFRMYQEADYKQLRRNYQILHQLKKIYNTYDLDDERVLAYCQPIMNISTNRYDTAEALMRLQLPELGFIYPNEFIDLLERYNYVHRFTMIMLNKVCKYLNKAMQDGYDINRISVNISTKELKKQNFLSDFKNIVEANGVAYHQIGVEFTESTDDVEGSELEKVVCQLQELGCKVYLDDFGTGYSNFNRLMGLHMDVLKFDRSFLLEADKNENIKHFILALSDAFKKMNYHVLFEGVETDEQEQFCKSCQADYLQGFKFSKPIPILDLNQYIVKK